MRKAGGQRGGSGESRRAGTVTSLSAPVREPVGVPCPDKLTERNGFRALGALHRAAADPRIQEIEGNGMERGRVFLHLHEDYWFGQGTECGTRSVGSAAEIREALESIELRP